MNGSSRDSASSSMSTLPDASVTEVLHKSNYDKADAFLSNELFGLSVHDRNAIHEEIHGVRCLAPEESPKLIVKSLHEFWATVAAIPDAKKTAYEQCRSIAASRKIANVRNKTKHYAIDEPSFHLRFLRCELFDAQKAATRYVNYLNFVHKLWGRIALEREIKFSDFNKEEARLFRKGNYQLLPVRDQSGRKVIVCLRKMSSETEYGELTKAKVGFYLWNSITFRDVESQRRGVVVVVDMVAWNGLSLDTLTGKISHLPLKQSFLAAIPARIVAIHHCLPDTPLTRIIKILLATTNLTSQSQRLRFKFHLSEGIRNSATSDGYSAALYTRYRMKGYGIPIELLPCIKAGRITTKNHALWARKRKYFEECHFIEGSDASGNGAFRVHFSDRHSPVLIVDCPGSNDVLFRQGKNMMEHPGNVMFRDLILNYLDREEAWKVESAAGCSKRNNSNITMQNHTVDVYSPEEAGYGKRGFINSLILNEIFNQRKGRFLEWDLEYLVWTIMTDLNAIKNKISIVFSKHRNRKSKSVAGQTAIAKRGHSAVGADQTNSDDAIDSATGYQFVQGRLPGACSGEIVCNSNRNSLDDPMHHFMRSTPEPSASISKASDGSESSSVMANRKRGRDDLISSISIQSTNDDETA